MKLLFLVFIMLTGCARLADPSTVASQVRGNGCTYNDKCEPHWSWWESMWIRHPEYRCRMMAAVCLTKLGSESKNTLTDLRAARNEMPETYDTGDGVIYYSKCIESVINKIAEVEESGEIYTCYS